ncbi:DUF1304 domain-containing protein [Nocardia stercoris]|uniref:DUF1304 domain-containing protein n=2 Tax=Nocardia stercoris TaxID=2483361 RepID=A0A3M2L3T5_9NOCA|nr:DUF1304 domain-containing protein [Nocardia stercoris]
MAALAGLVHVYIFVLESIRFTDPKVHRRLFRVAESDLSAVRNWAYNQGFYNLFLAIGAIAGAGLVRSYPATGWALIVLACGSMLAAAVVLITTDRAMLRSAIVQGMFPALTLLAGLTQL